MNFSTKTQAFNELGYDHKATRGVWTAERDQRVLVTLWHQQIRWWPNSSGGTLYLDMEELHPKGDPWRETLPNDSRHMKRARHLERVRSGAAELDIVILFGPVGNDEGRAIAWHAQEHENRIWQVERVCLENGFFRVEAIKQQVS